MVYDEEMEEMLNKINENVRDYLWEKLNLSNNSQQTEGNLIGFERTVYNKMLNGRCNFTLRHLCLISRHYNISVPDLISRTD